MTRILVFRGFRMQRINEKYIVGGMRSGNTMGTGRLDEPSFSEEGQESIL